MKVTLVCHSDLNGGAAIVTYRLMAALRSAGVDARTIVYTKYSDSDHVSQVSNRYFRGMVFGLERADIFRNNGYNRGDLFKVSTARFGMPLWRHPWVKDAGVVNLNWINQGLLSLHGIEKIARMGKPIVWTMHDMWCMTGICQHAYDCQGWLKECGNCPFLHKSAGPNDLSHRVWLRKKKLYESVPIQFVAVSNWLANQARRSTLMAKQRLTVIPNAFPTETFFTSPREEFHGYKLNSNSARLVMGAARLDDPIKGLDLAIEAINRIFVSNPTLANRAEIVFFGNLRNRSILDTLHFPYRYLGKISDPEMLRQIYASAKVVLSTSHYETLPGTLIEGQAAGALPVSWDHGGQSDIIDHMATGYLARYADIDDLVNGIEWALNAENDRDALHRSVADERFSAAVIARRYIDLYTTLL